MTVSLLHKQRLYCNRALMMSGSRSEVAPFLSIDLFILTDNHRAHLLSNSQNSQRLFSTLSRATRDYTPGCVQFHSREKAQPRCQECFSPSNTDFVSSSASSSPRLLIAPGLGMFCRGCAASARRYACCKALVRAICVSVD